MNPIMVGDYASFFICMVVGRASDSMTASSWSFNKWAGAWWFVFGLARRGSASAIL